MMKKKPPFKLKIKEKPVEEKKITTDFIKLDSFLKYADAAQTGGHAKMMISDGIIKVNGEVCTQRGKKIKPGDSVEISGKIFKVTRYDN